MSQSLKKIRKITLVAHDNSGSAILFDKVVNSLDDVQFQMVLTKGLYYKRSFLGSVIKLLRESSWSFVFLRYVDLVIYFFKFNSLQKKCLKKGIPIVKTYDVNSQDIIEKLKAFGPDVLVSLYTMQIYKTPVLKIPRYGALQVHPSLLPNYRGLESFFWVLANNEKETGVSVFLLNQKIDRGPIVRQQVIPITSEMTANSLYKKSAIHGGDLLLQSIFDIDQDQMNLKEQGKGSYYRMPNRDAFRRFRKLKRNFYSWRNDPSTIKNHSY